MEEKQLCIKSRHLEDSYVTICVWVYCLFFVYSLDCSRYYSRGASWKYGKYTSHAAEITGRTPSCCTIALCICCCWLCLMSCMCVCGVIRYVHPGGTFITSHLICLTAWPIGWRRTAISWKSLPARWKTCVWLTCVCIVFVVVVCVWWCSCALLLLVVVICIGLCWVSYINCCQASICEDDPF